MSFVVAISCRSIEKQLCETSSKGRKGNCLLYHTSVNKCLEKEYRQNKEWVEQFSFSPKSTYVITEANFAHFLYCRIS